jgi:hypothetical protein
MNDLTAKVAARYAAKSKSAPKKVDKYFDEVKKSNPDYSDEQAWATAWSIFCKHVEPGSDHCKKPTSEYLKGQK